ncbi:MAG: TonB-dependent receptor [Bacteroidales bacterium]|nr:TonB-dependent receptor [Bacteroidales bacterium]
MKGKVFSFVIKAFAVLMAGCLSISVLNAQTRSISGKVVDTANQPVVGASVMVVGSTSIGTVTDLDGAYKLNVPDGSSINVSCIGYASQVIAVGSQTIINVVLAEDSEFLEETVVIGYGVQKKSDLTGSIASVKDSDLANRSTISAAQALQGKAAGVQIVNASGAPGSDSNIQIRGYSSNTTTRPLMIVDGLKVNDINYLDPDNIASIEVLKDAASAAIYGIEAGNGVILVTTKSGKQNAGDGHIFYNFMSSTQSVSHLPDLMDADTYVKYQTLMGNDVTPYWDGKTDTYWPDYMLEKGQTFRHTVGAQAANDRGSIYVSVSYLTDNGIVAGDKDLMKRLTGQVNAEYKIKKWFTIGTNNSFERTKLSQVSEANSINASTLGSMLVYDPIVPWIFDKNNLPEAVANKMNDPYYNLPLDPDGNPYGYSLQGDGSLIFHPAVMRDRSDTSTESFNLRGTTFANITPVKGLVITSRFGYRAGYSKTSTFNHPYRITSIAFQDQSLTGRSSTNLFYQWENFANYNVNIKKHNLSAMAGFSFQKSNTDFVSATTYLLSDPAENYRYLSYSVNDARMTVSGVPTDRVNMSYYGRLSWSYDNRYMVQANFRADAYDTSKLDPSNRWGYFPSVSAGWTVSNEKFMNVVKDKIGLTFMKIRASWGVNGNVNAMGDYQYSDILTASNNNGYNFTDTGNRVVGVGPSGVLPNPRIKWETSKQVDLGIDLRFFRERLAFSLDWYNKNTNDLITSTNAPANTGSTTTYINAGKVNNHGTEIELSWKDTKGDFSYSVSGNLATLHNKVLEGTQVGRVPGYQIHTAEPVTYFEAGYPLWYLRLYNVTGVDQQTGAPIYADTAEPFGVINDDDRINAGSGIPDFTYGLTVNLAWKGIDLVIYGTGAQGVEKLFAMTRADNTQLNTLKEFYTDAWQSPASTGYKHPKPSNTDAKILCSTDRMFDASFFKIKQIQLGYTLPKSVLKKIRMDNLRVYMSLDDFITITKYPGLDPESSLYGASTNGLGVDTGSYPISKKLVFGLNLSF